jgi:ribosomal protein S6--L-glutamate ligase
VKILILSRSRHLYSTARLTLVCRARGHDVRVVDPLRCAMLVDGERSTLLHRGEPLGAVDAVIPRLGRSWSFAGLAVLRQLESLGVPSLNPSAGIAVARDKLSTLQCLARARVPAVATAFARDARDIRGGIEILGGPPVVVKLSDGSQGLGVMLAESAAGAESIVGAFHVFNQHILVQPYLRGDGDLRLIVAGGRVVAAMRRRAAAGEFRNNLHRGGVAVVHHPAAAETRVALDAVRATGLRAAGVDLIESPSGPLVLEVNASPGLRGIEAASGRNVAARLVSCLEALYAASSSTSSGSSRRRASSSGASSTIPDALR